MASFKFGTNTPYWDSSQPPPERSTAEKTFGVAALFGAGGAAFGAGFIGTSTGNVFDKYYQVARVAGHASPFGMLASLRVPEIISPFLSKQFQGGAAGNITWSSNFLQTAESRRWISATTGRTEQELLNLGIGTDSSLVFERINGVKGAFGQGDLFVETAQGKRVLLSKNMMVTERSLSSTETFVNRTNINQFASALGTVIDEDLRMRNAFVNTANGVVGGSAHRWLPVPSITGNTSTFAEVLNRLSYGRGLAAFEAQRLNRAIETIGENVPVIGEVIQPFLKSDSLLVKNGPALKTYMRYGGLAAKLGAGAMMVAEYDWLMRYKKDDLFNRELGYSISSTAIGMTAGYLAGGRNRSLLRNFRPMVAAVAGITAFMGQNVLPGFDKGIVAGVSDTLSTMNIMRAHVGEVSGFSTYRRKLEDIFPGVTSLSTGVFAGLLSYGAFAIRHSGENRYVNWAKQIKGLKDQRGMTWKNTLTDLDTHFEAWEKVSYNLKPGHDLATFKQAHAARNWRRSIIPGEALNQRFERNYQQMITRGASTGDKFDAVIKHLRSSSHAKYKGLTGGVVSFIAGMGLHAILSGKLLGSIEDSEQLERQATGEELIPVRKSRWWGAGGTPYEGGKISYYKPSLNAQIQSDSKNASLWGDEVGKYGPIRRFLLENFTYHLEEKHYEDRPYPISSPGFANFPFFGKLLGSTIGSIIKPPRLMHVDEWARANGQGETEYLNVPKRLDSNPALGLGGTGIGAPVSPYRIDEVFGDLSYRLREAAGLIGFVKNQFQKMVTGEEIYSSGKMLLAESGSMYDTAKAFWDLELGGLATLTEIPRRFLPKERSSARNRYNPIRNQMPSWLPQEFQRGDPYSTTPSGYARLPGEGYAALHPELKGIDPEAYPLWYKYEILANVAYYSDEFRDVKNTVYRMRKAGRFTPEVEAMIDRVDKQVESQKFKRNYFVETTEQRNQSFPERLARNVYLETIDTARMLAAPIEYLIPGGFRPFQKFLPVGDVVKDYERFSIYGSETSFWDFSRAWKDYLGPSFYSTIRLLGYSGIPPELQQKREIDQYFDRLTYFKYMKLSEQAAAQGDGQAAKEYRTAAHKTTYGVNPFGNPLSIYGSLPPAEKERYEGFARLYKESDRERVLELLPEDQKILFSAIWAKQDGIKISRDDKQRSSDAEKMRQLEEYFSQNPIPREDWIGWNADVDMQDIKLNYIKGLGYESFDFGMWPSQEQMITRKPYLEGAEEAIQYSPPNILSSLHRAMLSKNNVDPMQSTYVTNSGGFTNGTSVTYINDNQESQIRRELARWDEN